MENKINFTLTAAEQTQVNDALAVLASVLTPKTTTLTTQMRRELPKMSDGTVAFVEKTLEFSGAHASFVPPYMSVADFKVDFDAVPKLRSIRNQLSQLLAAVDDTMMLSGSEAYQSALLFYQSVRLATRSNVPGAKVIFEELKGQFDKISQAEASVPANQ